MISFIIGCILQGIAAGVLSSAVMLAVVALFEREEETQCR